jgi:hypothetical protein
MLTTPNLLLVLAVVAMVSLAVSSSGAEAGAPGADVLGLFPDSKAPTFTDKKSELAVQRHFQPWTRNSHWHPEVDEKSVFHASLQHKSVEERCWEVGTGKGGQIYSMCSSFGEAMPFQNPFKPGGPVYKKYEGRTVYRAYKRKTDWIELLGFVLPKARTAVTANTVPLAGVGGVSESFEPGEKEGADALLVTRASP